MERVRRLFDENKLLNQPSEVRWKEKNKYTKNGPYAALQREYRHDHTTLAKSTFRDETSTVANQYHIPENHGYWFLSMIMNMDNEKRSSQYHRFKESGITKNGINDKKT